MASLLHQLCPKDHNTQFSQDFHNRNVYSMQGIGVFRIVISQVSSKVPGVVSWHPRPPSRSSLRSTKQMDVQFQLDFHTNQKKNHLCSVRKDFDELGKGDLADFQPLACRVVNDRIPIFRRILWPFVISSEPIFHPGVFSDVESGLIECDER